MNEVRLCFDGQLVFAYRCILPGYPVPSEGFSPGLLVCVYAPMIILEHFLLDQYIINIFINIKTIYIYMHRCMQLRNVYIQGKRVSY